MNKKQQWIPFSPSNPELQTLDRPEVLRTPPGMIQQAVIGLARHTPMRRGQFRAGVSRFVFSIGKGKAIDVDFRGVTFRLFGDSNLIDYGLLLQPAYNKPDLDFLLEGLPSDGVFVDLGCNIGLYALPIARELGPDGRVIAIDANPRMVSRIKLNGRLSDLPNLEVVHCAVSDVEGKADLMIRNHDEAIVCINENEDGSFPVHTLANTLETQQVHRVDALKADVEGHEDKALVPFLESATGPMLPNRIVIEFPDPDSDYPGCAQILKQRGYQLVGRSRNNSFYKLAP